MSIDLQEKRDFMVTFLINAGFTISIPQGGCFLLANWSHLGNHFLIRECVLRATKETDLKVLYFSIICLHGYRKSS